MSQKKSEHAMHLQMIRQALDDKRHLTPGERTTLINLLLEIEASWYYSAREREEAVKLRARLTA